MEASLFYPPIFVRFKLFICLIVAVVCSADSFAVQVQSQTVQSNGFEYQIGPAPEWLKDNQYSLAENQGTEAVNYLLIDKQVRFHAGNALAYKRNVEQPLTTAGLQSTSKIEVSFNPVYQKLIWHNVTVKRGDKVLNRLNASAITLLQREESLDQEIVDGYVTAMLVISDTRKGDIIDFSYSIEGRNPIYDNHVFAYTNMGWSVPVVKLERRFIFDASDNVQYQLNHFAVKPLILEKDGVKELQWSLKNTAPVFVENDVPSWYDANPSIRFSSFQSWREVSNWAAPLYVNREITDPELLHFIEQIKPLPPSQQIAKALQFVQNEIRYLGVELGVNSHKPHLPNEVFKNRYGDCKDKTLLLISILEKLNISAYPALVSTYGGVPFPDELPSPNLFNHVITQVQLGEKVYWLDPTRELQSGTLDSFGYMSYDNALLVGHPSLDLVEMPKAAQALPEVRTYEYFNIVSYEGPVDYKIVTEYTGIEADYMRSRFANQGKLAMQRKYLNYMSRIYPSLELAAPLTVESEQQNNLLRVTEFYHLTEFFRKQPQYLLTDFYAFTLSDYFSLPSTVKRKNPLRNFSPLKVTHQSSVRYPEWLNMSLENDAKAIDTPYFSLSFSEDYRNKTLTTTHVYESKSSYVPVKAVSAHLTQLREAQDSLSKVYQISYEESPSNKLLGTFFEHLNKQIEQLKGAQL